MDKTSKDEVPSLKNILMDLLFDYCAMSRQNKIVK